MHNIFSLLTSVLLVLAFSADAQSPTQRVIPFQGRLTDRSGAAIPDGVRLVQFQIYSEATGGQTLWAGEVHRATINGGLVNVVLGTKNPLPRDRADQPDKSFFDQPLYLQITADANADNQITELDPPLLPRQTLAPVVFAQEAGSARTLQGYDWSVVFGTNSPAAGKISGSRISEGTVTASQLASSTITGSQLAPGSVGALQLAASSIQASHLTDGLVGLEKLAPRPVTNDAPRGGLARSLPVTTQKLAANTTAFEKIDNLTVTIETTGRPVLAFLSPSPGFPANGEPSGLYFIADPGASVGWFRLVRDDGVEEILRRFGSGAGGSQSVGYPDPLGLVLDLPPKGRHTYRLEWRFSGPTGGGYANIYNSVLVIVEL